MNYKWKDFLYTDRIFQLKLIFNYKNWEEKENYRYKYRFLFFWYKKVYRI